MGGGPSTPELVVAAANAGALGFLAAAYRSAEQVLDEIAAVRASTGEPFGVNVFVPGSPFGRPADLECYLASLAADAAAVGATLAEPVWDDDGWTPKVDALLESAPPMVSFTFGCPMPDVVAAFKDAGSVVAVTVTNAGEANVATAAGADCLCVQGKEAGAHRGTFGNDVPAESDLGVIELLREMTTVGPLPVIAAGGIMTADDVRAVLAAGAIAAQCGTAFLRCPESGANAAHKAALADPRYTTTAVTRAFSGRPARGLVNQFMQDHGDAPPAYPEINNATRPLRAAAARAGDTGCMSLWAGTGFRAATTLPVADVVDLLDPR